MYTGGRERGREGAGGRKGGRDVRGKGGREEEGGRQGVREGGRANGSLKSLGRQRSADNASSNVFYAEDGRWHARWGGHGLIWLKIGVQVHV